MSADIAIEGRNLTRRYGGFAAINNVSLAVPRGEIRGIIGPNGAGKSTLMDVLSGRATHWSGTVRFDGKDIGALSVQERRRIGLARSFQKTNIFPELTVAEQVHLAGRSAEIDNSDEVMGALGLDSLADMRGGDVSYGDRRRLDLALALVGRPKVLLMDEPAAGLTIGESIALAERLRQLAKDWQVTVLIVEHDMEVVFSICNRITVLHLGAILAEGTAEEIRRNPAVVSAYLGSAVA